MIAPGNIGDADRLEAIGKAAHVLAELIRHDRRGDANWTLAVHRAREKYLALVMWLPVEFREGD